jgi:hypothetical protein
MMRRNDCLVAKRLGTHYISREAPLPAGRGILLRTGY